MVRKGRGKREGGERERRWRWGGWRGEIVERLRRGIIDGAQREKIGKRDGGEGGEREEREEKGRGEIVERLREQRGGRKEREQTLWREGKRGEK